MSHRGASSPVIAPGYKEACMYRNPFSTKAPRIIGDKHIELSFPLHSNQPIESGDFPQPCMRVIGALRSRLRSVTAPLLPAQLLLFGDVPNPSLDACLVLDRPSSLALFGYFR